MVAIGHGWFNRFVARELRRQGWHGPRFVASGYWSSVGIIILYRMKKQFFRELLAPEDPAEGVTVGWHDAPNLPPHHEPLDR